MPFVWSITDYGSPQVLGLHMRESGEAAMNLQEPMSRIILDMMEIEKKVFSSGGRRGGGAWRRLATSTIAEKGHATILVDKSELIDSLTEPGAPHQIIGITRFGVDFGTNRPWAFVHQYGSAHVPKRPFLKFMNTDYDKWNNWILEYITKSFREPTVAGGAPE